MSIASQSQTPRYSASYGFGYRFTTPTVVNVSLHKTGTEIISLSLSIAKDRMRLDLYHFQYLVHILNETKEAIVHRYSFMSLGRLDGAKRICLNKLVGACWYEGGLQVFNETLRGYKIRTATLVVVAASSAGDKRLELLSRTHESQRRVALYTEQRSLWPGSDSHS
jgi:hypothetical protein